MSRNHTKKHNRIHTELQSSWEEPYIYFGCPRLFIYVGSGRAKKKVYLPDEDQDKVMENSWHVIYRYRVPDNLPPFLWKKYGRPGTMCRFHDYGMNREKDKEARTLKAVATKLYWKTLLQSGYDPFIEILQKYGVIPMAAPAYPAMPMIPQPVYYPAVQQMYAPVPVIQHQQPLITAQVIGFEEALNKAYQAKLKRKEGGYSDDTKEFYDNNYSQIVAYLKKKKLDKFPIHQVDRSMIKSVIEGMHELNQWGPDRFNSMLSFLSNLFDPWMVEEGILKETPLKTPIMRMAKGPREKFEPFTADERLCIKEHLLVVNKPMLAIAMLIYHSALRDSEIAQLRRKHFDFERGIIDVEYTVENPASKTKEVAAEGRSARFNKETRDLMLSYGADKADPEAFMFAKSYYSPLKKIKPAEQQGALYPLNEPFYPGLRQADTTYITRWWGDWVMADQKEGGVGIKKTIYGLKHTGIDDRTDKGLDVRGNQAIAGHTTERMTKRYSRKQKEMQLIELNKAEEQGIQEAAF